MHLIVHNMPDLPKVDRVYDFIVSILFITVQILSLASVTRVMEKERVVWSGVLHKPMHCPDDVCLGGMRHGVLLVIRQSHHILSLIAEMLVQVG